VCRLLHFGQGFGTENVLALYSMSNARKVLLQSLHLTHYYTMLECQHLIA